MKRDNDYTFIEEIIQLSDFIPTKKVSIIIPFYKGLDLLYKVLLGLSKQTYPNELFEVIISEDGNNGEANEIINEFTSHFIISLIQIVRNGYRVGTARNNGILKAKGEIIICLDFDMIPPPNFISNHARWYHFYDRLCVIGSRKFISSDKVSNENILNNFQSLYELQDIESSANKFNRFDNRTEQFQYFKKHPFPFNCFHGCNISFLKEHAIEVGFFDKSFDRYFGFEDIEFGLKLWKYGNYLIYEKDIVCLHQENVHTSIKDKEHDSLRNLKILYSKAPVGFKEFRLTIGKNF